MEFYADTHHSLYNRRYIKNEHVTVANKRAYCRPFLLINSLTGMTICNLIARFRQQAFVVDISPTG